MQDKQPTTELSNLSNHAVELNQKSDSWNEVIESWNARLAAMNIGLEYWLDEPLEETGMFSPGPEKPLCDQVATPARLTGSLEVAAVRCAEKHRTRARGLLAPIRPTRVGCYTSSGDGGGRAGSRCQAAAVTPSSCGISSGIGTERWPGRT